MALASADSIREGDDVGQVAIDEAVQTPQPVGELPSSRLLSAQGIDLDVEAHIAFRDGEALPRFPLKEFLILRLLLQRAGRVVSREEIMEQVWGEVMSPSAAKTLDVHVRRLRQHLERDPHHPVLIRTLRRCGYIFDVTPVPPSEPVLRASHL